MASCSFTCRYTETKEAVKSRAALSSSSQFVQALKLSLIIASTVQNLDKYNPLKRRLLYVPAVVTTFCQQGVFINIIGLSGEIFA
jgi:hypothetical protein